MPPRAPMCEILVCRSISKSLGGRTLFQDLSFSVPEGSITSVIGHNGSGKTTLLRILAGISAPDSGEVLVDGRCPCQVCQAVGFLPQHAELFPELTVRENIAYFAEANGRSDDTERLIGLLGVGPFADVRYRSLSGGQKRKTAVACAVSGDPKVLVLDEPSAGLDPCSRSDLWKVLRDLRDGGMAIVLSTHEISDARFHSDHILRFGRGNRPSFGPPSDVEAVSRVRVRYPHVPVAGLRSVSDDDGTVYRCDDGRMLRELLSALAEIGVPDDRISIDMAEELAVR